MKHPASTYRQLSVQGATPLGLVVMLYDGAIAALQSAVNAIQSRDTQQKCTELNRAAAIIAQLEGTLNFEKGGDVAKTLKSLYVYARGQMLKANLENSADVVRDLIGKMSNVREAWNEADHRPSAREAMPASTGASEEVSHATPPGPQPRPVMAAAKQSPYASSPAPEPGSWRVLA